MTDFIEFPCPHCSKSIRTSANYQGMKGQCPHCAKPVTVEAPAGQKIPLKIAEPITPPSTTHANAIVAGVIGAVATVALYLVFIAIHKTWIGVLFLDRGPIQFIITFTTCWGLAILGLKYAAVRRQLSYTQLELEFIPLQLGFKIDPKNVNAFIRHLDGLPKKARNSILGRRIRSALEHFRERSSVPEVQAYLSSHGDVDASMIEAGYTLLRAFIWAIPLFGFIGTVTGISAAVTGLADSLETAGAKSAAVAPAAVGADAKQTPGAAPAEPKSEANLGAKMIAAMGLVTQGLATAFDTTFLGLVTAILLLFPTEMLKRTEYAMLDSIETFTNESLLRRMSDDSDGGRLSPDAARLLEPVFCRHQQWLVEWQNQVAQLGSVIGQDFEKHAAAIRQSLERRDGDKAAEMRQLASLLSQAVQQGREITEHLRNAGSTVSNDLAASLDRLEHAGAATAAQIQSALQASDGLQTRLTANTDQIRELAQQWQTAQATVTRTLDGGRLEQVLESLDRNTAHLATLIAGDGQPAPGEAVLDRPAGRGFWPFRRRG